MDRQLLSALNNLSEALQKIADLMEDRERNREQSPITTALQSIDDIDVRLRSIDEGVKKIIDSNKEILDNQKTIMEMSRSRSRQSPSPLDKAGDKKNQDKIGEGLQIILAIAAGILAIGMAFKIIGTVDVLSVIAISIALPLIAIAIQQIVETGVTDIDALNASAVMIIASLGILGASYILAAVKPIGIGQLLTTIGLAAAFYFIGPSIGRMIQGISEIGLNWPVLIAALAFIPLIMIAASLGIVGASYILSGINVVSLSQLITAVFIAGVFALIGFSISELSKNIGEEEDPKTVAETLPLIAASMVIFSIAIVASSYVFGLIKPISLSQFITAVAISAVFVVLAYAVSPIIEGMKGATVDDVLNLGFLMVVLAAAIVATSYVLPLMNTDVVQYLWPFVLSSIAIGIGVLVMGGVVWALEKLGVLKMTTKKLDEAAGVIIILATAIAVSSWLLSFGNYTSYPDLMWSLSVGVSLVLFGGSIFVINKLGGPKEVLKGVVTVMVIAAAIVATSYTLSVGSYGNYPSLDWALGVGLSLAAFGVGAVLLGSQVFNPFFYAGLGVVLVVAASVVAASYILSTGSYDSYPPLEWATSTSLLLGTFAGLAFLLGAAAPVIALGIVVAFAIIGTMFAIDEIFSRGDFTNFPPEEWSRSTMDLLGKFAKKASDFSLSSPFILLGSITALAIAGSIFLIDKIFSRGTFKKFPSDEWNMGVSNTMIGFTNLIDEMRSKVGLISMAIGLFKMIGMAKSILKIDRTFSMGRFQVFPSKEWVDGTFYALEQFGLLASKQSWLSALGDKIASFFGADTGSAIGRVADTIVSVDLVLSGGSYKNYPSKDWSESIVNSLGFVASLSSSAHIENFNKDPGFAARVAQAIFWVSEALGSGNYKNAPGQDWTANVSKSILEMLSLYNLGNRDQFQNDPGFAARVGQAIYWTDNALKQGDFTKSPPKEWVDNTIYALQKFQEIVSLLSFGALGMGGFSGIFTSLFGGPDPLQQAVSNIELLATTFEKLGQSMQRFSSSMENVDVEKLDAVKNLAGSVVLMSLMDSTQFTMMIDALESKTKVFVDVMNSMSTTKGKKLSSPITKVTQTGGKNAQKTMNDLFEVMNQINLKMTAVVSTSANMSKYVDEKRSGSETNLRSYF